MFRTTLLLALPLLAALVLACTVADDSDGENPVQGRAPGPDQAAKLGAAPTDENDPRWHDEVRDIAAVYEHWLRVDDEVRWAPWLCSMPTPSKARLSDARKGTPHARKLYTLYAKDPESYQVRATEGWTVPDSEAARRIEPMSQVIVKQAWKPERMDGEPDSQNDLEGWGRSQLRPVRLGDHWYRGHEFAGLFMMFKPEDPELPTDAGWIYATLSPDGRKVTGAGRMASCMKCHARHEGRLFGLSEDEDRGWD